jgi:hypothetical protein
MAVVKWRTDSATPPFLYIRGNMAEVGMVDRYYAIKGFACILACSF